MEQKSVFIFGKSGRMGREVAKVVKENRSLRFVGGFSQKDKNHFISPSPDIVIDFSLPQAFCDLRAFIEKHNSSLVSGTTGWSKDQKKQLEQLGKKVPVFWAANMSFGIHLMRKLIETMARYEKFHSSQIQKLHSNQIAPLNASTELYSYQIQETHHIHKKDKPSGTALVLEKTARDSGLQLKETKSERKKEVFGIHRLVATSENERLEIQHLASNRKLFAKGAVDISVWLCQQKPGFYGMDDFLGSSLSNGHKSLP